MLKCRICASDTTVRETRTVGNYVRRRRHCTNTNCNERLTTIEVPLEHAPERGVDDPIIVSRVNLERMLKVLVEPLLARYGMIPVTQMLDEVALKLTPELPANFEDPKKP
jgi:hypothetical protein